MEKIIGVRVDDKLHAALLKLAQADNRKLSDYIRVQLKNLVEQSKKKS